MDIFEYLPQLIVAYDGNDEFVNLIHVKKADKNKDYLCPCCGGIVKPRALDSNKEQSHYYHKTGKCTKESQLHFFCKNWLFETGSKFYINGDLFEVDSIDIEKKWNTEFGDYIPDITVYTTSGKIIYFEMFFSNRKTGDDYFCKWDALGNDVVEVNIKEYIYKTDENTIPIFSYLYHNGVCYSRTYVKKDLYANTIAKIKRDLTRQKVLNYRTRIEQLDWFWQKIRNNETKESILDTIALMEYEDMLSCYSIIKRKQCVSYLKNDVLNMINQKVISDVRNSLDLPYDENVYFDLKHVRGRTYEAGIRLNLKTEHITYNDLYCSVNKYGYFDRLKGYPKIVFTTNTYNASEIIIPKNETDNLKNIFKTALKYKQQILDFEHVISKFEDNGYKIKVKNNRYTVLAKIHGNKFEVVLDGCHIKELDINRLSKEIQDKIKEIQDKEFLNEINTNDKYVSMLSELKYYTNQFDYKINIKHCNYSRNPGIYFKIYSYSQTIYDKLMQPCFEDFCLKIQECKNMLDAFSEKYSDIITLVEKINSCKNGFWKAEFLFDYYGYPEIKIDQKIIHCPYRYTYETVKFDKNNLLCKQDIIFLLEEKMRVVMKNLENHGCRVMEVEK